MRKNRVRRSNPFRILTVDDDQIMTSTIQAYFQRNGYEVDAENDPTRAIERVRNGNYDIMLLDFLMTPICGNQVVEEIRKFDKDLYIILLTGHKSMAPPVKTIRELEIQGYYEKSTRFDQLELLVESCTKSIDQIRQIRRYEEGLSKIIDYMTDIYKYNSLQEMADGILAKADDLVPAEAGFILFETEDKATVSATKGMEEVPENREGFYLFPVMDASHKQVGMIGLKYGEDPETARLQLLKIFVRQAAAALVNRSLHFQLNEAYQGMISTLRYTVEARDEETRGHSDRVSKMAAILSEYLGMDHDFICRIKVAGLFHDIGKIGIPDRILRKPDRVTREEYEEIRNHPVIGSKILSGLADFRNLVPIVRGHHERIDGTGYPDGLRGEEIPEGARILSIVDAFDALVSNRVYRSGRSWEEALDEIRRNRGSQFDAEYADGFIRMMTEDPQPILKLYSKEGES